jgi:hypothetical protein
MNVILLTSDLGSMLLFSQRPALKFDIYDIYYRSAMHIENKKTKLRPENNVIVESRYNQDIDRGLAREMAICCSRTGWE